MDKILVVDEDTNERNGLCRLLEHAGYEVHSAADGVEALQKVRNGNFDLMLLDISRKFHAAPTVYSPT